MELLNYCSVTVFKDLCLIFSENISQIIKFIVYSKYSCTRSNAGGALYNLHKKTMIRS